MLLDMYDASDPIKPNGFTVTCGYIGGATPHVWTPQEWNTFGYQLKLPSYAASWFATRVWDAVSDANECIRELQALKVEPGSTMSLDMETQVNQPYVAQFDSMLQRAGYLVMPYGSDSTIFGNGRTSGGIWAAHWDRTKSQGLIAGSVATQYANVGPYDLDLILDSVPLWGRSNNTPVIPTGDDFMYLIGVSPDPTDPTHDPKSEGIYAVHEGLGPVHVDGPTYTAEFIAKHGPVEPVSVAYYNALVAAVGNKVQGNLTLSGTVSGTGTVG